MNNNVPSVRRMLRRGIETIPTLESVLRTAHSEWQWQSRKTARTPHGFLFAGNKSMLDGSFEPKETALVLSLCPEFDVLVDVGANIGFYTCLAVSQKKMAVAVEPFADNVRFICENLSNNGWSAEVWPVGLAREPGIAFLYGGGTGASLHRGWAGVTDAWKRPVPLNTLDNIIGTRFADRRLLIKIDVEGAELDTLRGAEAVFGRKPLWIVEITLDIHRATPNPNFVETFEFFWSRGYSCFSVEHDRLPIKKTDVERWSAQGKLDAGYANWLFIPD